MVAVTESSFLHLSWCHHQQLWHIPLYLVLLYPEADHPGPTGHDLLPKLE